MRILVISNYYPPHERGGWGQLTGEVVTGMAARGHQVQVLASRHRSGPLKGPEKNVERSLYLQSPDHFHYHPLRTLTTPFTRIRNSALVRRAVTSLQPDVIFINDMWNLSADVALAAEGVLPDRVAYYMAGPWPTDPDPHRQYWSDPARRMWRRPLKQLAGLMVRPILPKDVRALLKFGRVLCVSDYMKHYMMQQVGIPESHLRVVRNGIDLGTFHPRRNGTHSGPLRLLVAGRLTPDKGIRTAIDGLDRLRKKDRSWNGARLSIVGDGPPDYVGSMKQLVDSLQLGELVEFRGRVDRSKMPEILAEHDVFIFPSVWQEPLARAVQEAMACGLVVVGTPTGGTGELLRHAENGLIFEPEDPESLAMQIEEITRDKVLRKRLSKAARATAERFCSFDRMLDEVEYHIHEMIGT